MAQRSTSLGVKITGDLADIRSALVSLNSRLDQTGKAGAKAGADASRGLDGIGASAGRIRGRIAGLFAGLSVGALFKGILDNTRESEAAIAQLNAGLKSTNGIAGVTATEISALADSLAGVTTFGDDAIVSMASVLATFTNIRTTVFKDAIPAILDLSTRLKIDLDGAAKLVGKSLNDPIKGIGALAKAGVQFSPVLKKQIEDLVKLGDVAGAQRIILQQLATTMGGSATAAADTLGGAIDQAKNAFGNLLEGDSSSGGLKDAKTAFQDLTRTLNDPAVKQGFASMIEGLAYVVTKAAEAIKAVNGLRQAFIDATSANEAKSYDGLLARSRSLSDQIYSLESTGRTRTSPFAGNAGTTIDQLRAELAEVRKLEEAYRRKKALERAPVNSPEYLRLGGELQWEMPPAAAAGFQADPLVDTQAAERAAAEAKRKAEALARERERLREEIKKADEKHRQDLIDLEVKVGEGLADVQIALKRALGDEAGAAFDEIEQKYAKLIEDLKATGNPAGVAIVERLINLEKVDAQLAQFKAKMQAATGASGATIDSLSGQAAGGLITSTEADEGRTAALERELAVQQQLLATARAYLATLAADSPEAAKTLQFIEQLNGRIGEVQATQNQFAQSIKDQAVQSLTGFFSDLASGTKSFKDAFLDMVRNFVAGIAQMIAQKLALKAVDAIFSSFGAFHAGGIVGAGGTIRSGINPMVFGFAPRYHGGGIAGLAPNETAAVLLKGEEVLTQSDPRHRRNAGAAGGRQARQKTVILFDAEAVASHMQTEPGERAVLEIVGRNAGAIREILA